MFFLYFTPVWSSIHWS